MAAGCHSVFVIVGSGDDEQGAVFGGRIFAFDGAQRVDPMVDNSTDMRDRCTVSTDGLQTRLGRNACRKLIFRKWLPK